MVPDDWKDAEVAHLLSYLNREINLTGLGLLKNI